MIYKINDTAKAEKLFQGWQETLIWSCLQGVMGDIYADSLENPQSAMAIIGDFAFFAGNSSKELVSFKPTDKEQDFIILTPQNDAWGKQIEAYFGERSKKVTRYATKKEPDVFDRKKLQEAVAGLPEEYALHEIDEKLYLQCKENGFSRDLVSQYADYADYQKKGLGVAVLKGEEVVAGASSYTSYLDGIEIEIDTREDCRRQGLAYACGAKLILECLQRGLYPSWDAQNKWSLALSEKLGYHFDHAYTAYEVFPW